MCTEAGEEKYVYRAQCVLLNSEQDERSLGRGTDFFGGEERFLSL